MQPRGTTPTEFSRRYSSEGLTDESDRAKQTVVPRASARGNAAWAAVLSRFAALPAMQC